MNGKPIHSLDAYYLWQYSRLRHQYRNEKFFEWQVRNKVYIDDNIEPRGLKDEPTKH